MQTGMDAKKMLCEVNFKEETIKKESDEENALAFCDFQTSTENSIAEGEFLYKTNCSSLNVKTIKSELIESDFSKEISVKLEPQESNPEPFEYLQCGFQASDGVHVQNFVIKSEPNEIEDAHCENLLLESRNCVETHLSSDTLQREQPADGKKFSCKYCNFRTKKNSNLNSHMLIHQPDSKKFSCDYCDYRTTWKHCLKTHMLRHQPDSDKLCCDHCDYKTTWKNCLKAHLLSHQPESKEFSCDYCEYTTKWKFNLNSHISMHQPNSKKFSCDYCEYTSRKKSDLKRHISRHLPETKKLTCDYCDYTAREKHNLNRHMSMHQPDGELLSCDYCNYTTRHKYNLNRHMSRKRHGK